MLHSMLKELRRLIQGRITAVTSPDFEGMLREFYESLDLDDAVAIDVGAHTGLHAVPLARCVGENGLVLAFEPVPHIRRQLVQRCIDGDVQNVAVYPFALSDRDGQSEFNFVPNLPEEGGLKQRKQYNARPSSIEQIRVAIHRLDSLAPCNLVVKFLKIDVEGGELDVLRGAVGLLERDRPVVAFECGAASFLGYHNEPEAIFNLLRELDYRVFTIHGDEVTDAESFRAASFAQQYWDYLALPSFLEHPYVARPMTTSQAD